MKRIYDVFLKITSAIIGKQRVEQLLVYSAKSLSINLHLHGLIQVGGLSNYDSEINGETFFTENILSTFCDQNSKLVFFDIGANIGDNSLALRKRFANAEISAFEPVKNTYDLLLSNTAHQNIKTYNIGFSDKTGTGTLFNTVDNAQTEMASVYKEVFQGIFKKDGEVAAVKFVMETIDNFCLSKNVTGIDFLKIDVEGHELSVLYGAKNMLLNKQIKCIQFEFNSHNVYSRVFLRDFYLYLNDFEFYRVVNNGIVQLGPYSSYNEIFLLQNILTVRKDISHLIEPEPLQFPY